MRRAGRLRTLFARAAHLLDTGGHGAGGARRRCGRGARCPELAFVAVALDVQHQTGGSMGQVLDAARDSVEGELELRRSLRVQTAQAKLSARVVSVMPFALVAVFSLVSEDFLAAVLRQRDRLGALGAGAGHAGGGRVAGAARAGGGVAS